MFTGIIQALGYIAQLDKHEQDARLVLHTGKLDLSDVQLGDSIAVNGVCLTVIEFDEHSFSADVSAETLSRTSLGDLNQGDAVNLEKALRLADRLGGHLVSGHVDGLGELVEIKVVGQSQRLRIKAPENLAYYVAEKGSVCIDGISLTVNRIENHIFELNIVPHTLKETTLSRVKTGQWVNLEVDVIARYVERLLQNPQITKENSSIDEAFLARHGFA